MENGQNLVTRNFSKGTFEKNLDSVEGFTADDNQCSLDDEYVNGDEDEEDSEEQQEDVLSRSQSGADEDDYDEAEGDEAS